MIFGWKNVNNHNNLTIEYFIKFKFIELSFYYLCNY
jgi:hypothetical protein